MQDKYDKCSVFTYIIQTVWHTAAKFGIMTQYVEGNIFGDRCPIIAQSQSRGDIRSVFAMHAPSDVEPPNLG